MSLNYPEILKGVVAASGDKNDIPAAAQAAGFASFAEGFGPLNGLPLASGGIAPKRADMNGFLNLLSQHSFWVQSGGLYTWSSSLDYGVPAMVVGSDGVMYLSLQASGPSGAGAKDPVSSPTYWATLKSVVGGGLAGLDVVRGWTTQQYSAPVVRTGQSGSQAVDMDAHQMLSITATAAIAFAAPTNLTVGKTITIMVYSASAVALTWDASFLSSAGYTLPASTTAGKWLIMSFLCHKSGAVLLTGVAEEA
jgi:hypothetical protein